MPREVIYEGTPAEPGHEPLLAEVAWQRQCWLQLRIRRAGSEDADGAWSVDLTRVQVNELIRVLRRARNQAYGQDE